MLTLTEKEWHDLSLRLSKDWPLSFILIRSTMKRELGFTVRRHKTYTEQHGIRKQICLDFYDDAKETWFRLKYL